MSRLCRTVAIDTVTMLPAWEIDTEGWIAMGESRSAGQHVDVEVAIIEAEISADHQPEPEKSTKRPDPDTVYEGSEPDTAHHGATPGTVYEGGAPGMSDGASKEETVYEGTKRAANPETVYEGTKPGAKPETVYEGSKPGAQSGAQPGTVYEGEAPDETEGGPEKEGTVYEG